MKRITVIAITILLLTACNNQTDHAKEPVFPQTDTLKPPPTIAVNADSILTTITTQILKLAKDKDYAAIGAFLHPADGVRFSPYGFINTSADKHFTKAEYLTLTGNKNKQLNWGNYDGSGDPIMLTLAGYFQKFVYDEDFLNATQTSVNKMIGSGNSLNNLEAVYIDAPYTENYFPGFDKKYEGMDWKTIRLVYRKYEGQYYLIAVVHDQWTI